MLVPVSAVPPLFPTPPLHGISPVAARPISYRALASLCLLSPPRTVLPPEGDASLLLAVPDVPATTIDAKDDATNYGGCGGGGCSGLQSKRRAAHLQGKFGSNQFAPADPPNLLNYEGCELLLISASDNVEEELGLDLHMETETETEHGGDDDSTGAACLDLVKMFGEVADVKPLLSGSWD